jgi:hypothetical protein
MRTYVRIREWSYTVTEHDPDHTWIVVGQARHIATLEAEENFFLRARERWPEPRWSVELDPRQL